MVLKSVNVVGVTPVALLVVGSKAEECQLQTRVLEEKGRNFEERKRIPKNICVCPTRAPQDAK